MTTQHNTRKDRALTLLTLGHANPSEAAELARVSRQLVNHWLRTERIDWRTPRRRRLQQLWGTNTRGG